MKESNSIDRVNYFSQYNLYKNLIKSNHNSNGNLSKISTGFFSRDLKENRDAEKEKEIKITLSNSFMKNYFENRSPLRKECLSIEKNIR